MYYVADRLFALFLSQGADILHRSKDGLSDGWRCCGCCGCNGRGRTVTVDAGRAAMTVNYSDVSAAMLTSSERTRHNGSGPTQYIYTHENNTVRSRTFCPD